MIVRIVFFMLCSMLFGCGSIFQGSSQKIDVVSVPAGAKVFVDGDEVGVAPQTIKVSRKKDHKIALSMPGHEIKQIDLVPGINHTTWFNGLLGPAFFVGLLGDSLWGGLYAFPEKTIEHRMVKLETIPQVHG